MHGDAVAWNCDDSLDEDLVWVQRVVEGNDLIALGGATQFPGGGVDQEVVASQNRRRHRRTWLTEWLQAHKAEREEQKCGDPGPGVESRCRVVPEGECGP